MESVEFVSAVCASLFGFWKLEIGILYLYLGWALGATYGVNDACGYLHLASTQYYLQIQRLYDSKTFIFFFFYFRVLLK